MIRILLVEDQQLLREGMRLVLEADSQLRVTGQVGGGQEALQAIQTEPYDVVLLDLSLPDMDGTECLAKIRQDSRTKKLPVLVVSMHESQVIVQQALEAGADGYVLKTATPFQLRQAAQEVAAGKSYIQAGLLANSARPQDGAVDALESPLREARRGEHACHFSKAEREILNLVGREYSWAQMLTHLALSPATLESRVRGLYRKLEVSSLESAYRKATEQGLILPNPHRSS